MNEKTISRLPPAEQDERNMKRLMERHERNTMTLWKLIADLSGSLSDEGDSWSNEGLDTMRRRVANAVPPHLLPEWFAKYRDPAIVHS